MEGANETENKVMNIINKINEKAKKYEKIFDFNLDYININKKIRIEYKIKFSKILVVYKPLIKMLKMFKNIFEKAKIKTIFIFPKKLKEKNLLMLLYSLTNNIKKEFLSQKENFYFKIILSFYNLKIKLSKNLYYLTENNQCIWNQINYNTLPFFLSDYLTYKLEEEDNSSNTSVDKFVNKFTDKINKSRNTNIFRFPAINIKENDFNTLYDFLNNKLFQIKKNFLCLTFDFFLKGHESNCFVRIQNYSELENRMIQLITTILKYAQFPIINFKILNVDECFGIDKIVEVINQLRINKIYFINFKVITTCNHNMIDLEENGTSFLVNKTLCNLSCIKNVLAFFFVINNKFPSLKKNYIKYNLYKYMVDYKFHDIDRCSTQLKNNIINIPKNISKIFKHIENTEEVRNMLILKNYDPLK
jgi:hypothetical protein